MPFLFRSKRHFLNSKNESPPVGTFYINKGSYNFSSMSDKLTLNKVYSES